MLLERLRARRNTVLIIDEAQNLSSQAALEEVRLLSNLETDTEKLMQIVLTGQPELLTKLGDPSLRQLRQRIAIEHHIERLPEEHTREYLAHRISVAGGDIDTIFKDGFEEHFFRFSNGCPRLLSLLADRVMLSAYAQERRPIPAEFVAKKVGSMEATRLAGLGGTGEGLG